MDKLIEHFLSLNESGAVKRFVEEMELDQDDKIVLMWAIQKGYIEESFPTYHEMMDKIVALPGTKKVEWEDVQKEIELGISKGFADTTDVMVHYVEKILLPKAKEAWKNRETKKPPRKIDPVKHWLGTEWVCRTELIKVHSKSKPAWIKKGDEFIVEDVYVKDGKLFVEAGCISGEYENGHINVAIGWWKSNFELDETTVEFEEEE